MSYKTELQSNNVDLQGILDKVNALPEMEEAPKLPTLSNPAAAAQILSGYEVLDQHGIKLTGIMEDNGAVSQALNAGESYTIPAGYHNGSGKVTGNSLASQTSATAAAADIASGKTAWVNGSKVTGTLTLGDKQLKKTSAYINTTGSVSVVRNGNEPTIEHYTYLVNANSNNVYICVYNNSVIGFGVTYSTTGGYFSFSNTSTTSISVPRKSIKLYELV